MTTTSDLRGATRALDESAAKQDLLFAATAIARRRGDLIRKDMAERLFARHWIEWRSGALRLTADGMAVCDDLLATVW